MKLSPDHRLLPRCRVLFALWLVILDGGLTVSAADSLPRVPPPEGFIDGSSLSERIRAVALAGQPRSVRLLGLYYPTNALAEILNKGYAAPSPFCKALLREEYSSTSDAKKGFQTLVKNAKAESDMQFDPNNPAIRRIVANYEKAARKIQPGVAVKLGGMSSLGHLLDRETVFASSGIMSFAWSDGQTQVDMPFAVSVAWMRFGKQQVELGVLYPFRDASSVTAANQKLLEWIGEIEKRNPKE